MAELIARNLSFRYSRAPQKVLHEIDLLIPTGQCVAIWGEAKSTLLMALCGVIPHLIPGQMEGEVLVEGLNTRKTPLRVLATKIGVVLQDPENQLFNLTVEDDVAFGMENVRFERALMEERLTWALDLVGLSEYRQRSSAQLSGGQKQRAAIASVLAMQPGILVLDEPTRELDPLGTEEVFQVLQRLKSQGVTIVIVENDPANIVTIADRILYLQGGKVVVDGVPGEFYKLVKDDPRVRMPQVTEAYFRSPPRHPDGTIPLTAQQGRVAYAGG